MIAYLQVICPILSNKFFLENFSAVLLPNLLKGKGVLVGYLSPLFKRHRGTARQHLKITHKYRVRLGLGLGLGLGLELGLLN